MSTDDKQMRTIREAARDVPVREEVDVLVCGGGSSGICAALAAARLGLKVTLVESHGFLGGVTTAMGVNGIGGWQFDVDGRPLINGLPMDVMRQMAKFGGASEQWVSMLGKDGAAMGEHGPGLNCYWVHAHPEYMKIALDQMMLEAGVRLVYHADAVLPVMQAERVAGAFIESKSGRQAVLAKVTIDCTGDGDIAARAGCAFKQGRPGDAACQPMTMVFTVSRWDRDAHYREIKSTDLGANRYAGAMKLARERGEVVLNPNDLFCAATYLDATCQPGRDPAMPEANINFTRIQNLDATDVDDLTRGEILGREQVLEAIRFMRKYMAGFNGAELVSLPAHVGIRESRRIVGRYTLSGEDVQHGRRFDDGIARGIYTLDIHNPTEVGKPSRLEQLEQPYDIPYRCLVPADVDGLLVAGRCISGDSIAMSSYRIQSHCMAIGQAAGTAAALAVQENQQPAKIDADMLRDRLRQDGANLGPESHVATSGGR